MSVGTVKKIISDRRFGFIVPKSGGKEVYFDDSVLEGVDFEALREGDQVDYKAERGDKGPRATVVRKIHKVV
jgi:cold shock protein